MEEKKYCGGCVRFRQDHKNRGKFKCSNINVNREIFKDDIACDIYWDREEQEAVEKKRTEQEERKRLALWEKNKNNPAIKLPIVNDGYGMIPMCPTCGEMSYSTAQCHWCGQKFIQDEKIEEYSKPSVVEIKCPSCGGKMVGTRSKYNGHFHGSCEECGCVVIQ